MLTIIKSRLALAAVVAAAAAALPAAEAGAASPVAKFSPNVATTSVVDSEGWDEVPLGVVDSEGWDEVPLGVRRPVAR
jgi:hypothetical protein